MIQFLAGFATGFVTTIPPGGPIAVLVLSEATRRQARSALAIGVGASLAMGVWSALGWLGADHLVPPTWIVGGRVLAGVLLGLVGAILLLTHPKPAAAPPTLSQCFAVGAVGMGTNPVLLVNFAAAASGWMAIGCAPGGTLGAEAFGAGVAIGAALWFAVAVTALSRMSLSDASIHLARRGLGLFALGAGVVALALTAALR